MTILIVMACGQYTPCPEKKVFGIIDIS